MDALRCACSPSLVLLPLAIQALLLASADPVGASSVAPSRLGPLAGCTARAAKPDGAWRYQCRGFTAAVVDAARALEPGPYLDGREADLRQAQLDDLTFAREQVRIGGREATLLRAQGARGTLVVVAVLAAAEGTRVVSCLGPAERCDPALETLATAPWRAGAARGTRQPSEGERRLTGTGPHVPPGCRAMPSTDGTPAGMIGCPGGHHAGWFALPDDERGSRDRDELVARIRASRPWAGAPEELPCRIAGMDASCTRLTATGRVIAMWGTATVEETRWFAFCFAGGEEPVPAPCSSVFELR